MLNSQWVGRRVTVRSAVAPGPDGRVKFRDRVGDLLRLTDDVAVLDSRRGVVEIPLSTVAIARLVVPSTADELALEAIAARGWRPAETAELGGWLLRANSGFTERANSVLPLRAVGMPLDQAIETAQAWYHDRGLPLRFAVPTESRRLLDAELGERGWASVMDVHVMAARLEMLIGASTDHPTDNVQLANEPDKQWLARHDDGNERADVARALLTRHDCVAFASLTSNGTSNGTANGTADGTLVATVRGTVDDGWLGVTALEVSPDARRRGHAKTILRALWQWGADQGASRSYLQVESDNAPAIALYQSLGYWIHHDYRYWDEPAT